MVAREYSWGQDVLEHIGLDPKEDGLCYELARTHV
jgi:hypothetical protein